MLQLRFLEGKAMEVTLGSKAKNVGRLSNQRTVHLKKRKIISASTKQARRSMCGGPLWKSSV